MQVSETIQMQNRFAFKRIFINNFPIDTIIIIQHLSITKHVSYTPFIPIQSPPSSLLQFERQWWEKWSNDIKKKSSKGGIKFKK